MENKWDIYRKTLNNMYKTQETYMEMIIYYYNLVIKGKLNDKNYIRKNYKIDVDFSIFEEYILQTKNVGIFTIFNNIPDIIHPLEENHYSDYGCYLSFIKPTFASNHKDIIILNNNIWNENKYEYPMIYQDKAPYNYRKKYVYMNIKYYDHEKYKNYLIIKVNNKNEIFSYANNVLKKKIKDKWVVINKSEMKNYDWIYACVLRKIDKQDLLNVFNVSKELKSGTLIYSNHGKEKSEEKLTFFGTDPEHNLQDPFDVFYKKGDKIHQYVCKLKEDITCINFACDILSNNELTDTVSIDRLIEDNDYNKDYVYNANLNYIRYNKNPKLIWKNNYTKRFMYEILLKSSNFINMKFYYFDILHSKFKIDYFINAYGYYNKSNKFFKYELGFYSFDKNLIEIVEDKEITI
jgi:hypothetical protein